MVQRATCSAGFLMSPPARSCQSMLSTSTVLDSDAAQMERANGARSGSGRPDAHGCVQEWLGAVLNSKVPATGFLKAHQRHVPRPRPARLQGQVNSVMGYASGAGLGAGAAALATPLV